MVGPGGIRRERQAPKSWFTAVSLVEGRQKSPTDLKPQAEETSDLGELRHFEFIHDGINLNELSDEGDAEQSLSPEATTTTEEGESSEGSAGEREEVPGDIVRPDTLQAPPSVQKLVSVVQADFHQSITISDDQSVLEKVEERNLLALRDREEERLRNEARDLPPGFNVASNHALQDYQMQLMLLEQQNKKRLLMAGQEQEMMTTSMAEPGEAEWITIEEPIMPNRSTASGKRHDSEIDLLTVLNNDVSNMSTEELQSCLRDLQARAKRLKTGHEQEKKPPCRYQILYRILHEQTSVSKNGRDKVGKILSPPFFDPPEQIYGQGNSRTLRCKAPVQNFELFLEQNKDISFIVYRTYISDHEDQSSAGKLLNGHKQEADIPIPVEESIRPVSHDLLHALESILESREEYADMLQKLRGSLELHAPYLFMYHNRRDLDAFRDGLQQQAKEQFTLFSNFVVQQHGSTYASADSMISQGNISTAYVDYLFKPGDVLISRHNNGYRGWVASSWARRVHVERVSRTVAEAQKKGAPMSLYGSRAASKRMANDTVVVHNFSIQAWFWDFDGNFQRKDELLKFSIQAEEKQAKLSKSSESRGYVKSPEEADQANDEGVPIDGLTVFPISFASPGVITQLRQRGKVFWQCRVRRYVSYCDKDRDGMPGVENERYMIDLKTYQRLHGYVVHGGLKDELGPEAIAQDDPPDEQFLLLLPLSIKGYNLRRKKWYDLMADRVSEVQWNVEAFQKVVIDRRAKDLIRALVSNQLAMEVSTDLIEGKGNGLILLLHGSPGTGKTLTAESVAEIAEKPLYRVTCGDVGTKAEDVEKYLESVFHLGKLWGCVVLLDEADVFLEQRSLEDLQRNALVSVFLRMLEYYEGILVLTSNRVGIFDEAFKSRIQLALHYPTLGPYQRLRIWENFIERLASFHDDSVDIADLRDNLEKLAEEKMNGRQIRNAITTARQYTRWKETTLTYEHLRDVIDVSGRFDKYLHQLNGGFTQDQLAEDEGIRLA
ncbi:MAG: hypothetical protein M1822_001940 [Bathelium mastoideum]|nr:MAG: hypothetical protein M1822_001940 [Bathelium mastoideum]